MNTKHQISEKGQAIVFLVIGLGCLSWLRRPGNRWWHGIG